MADNDRNERKNYRSSEEWSNDSNNRNRDRNKSNDYEAGNSSRYGQDEGNYNQWNRQSDYNRDSQSGKYNRDYNSGNSGYGGQSGQGNQDENYGYGGREYGSNYGGGNYQGNNSYWSSGQDRGNSGRSSYGNSRNLYDRDYEGYNRDSSRGQNSNTGGANYGGNNEQRGRGNEDRGNYGNSGSNFGGEQRGRYGRGDSNDRSWWDKTRDEVSSWFGDESAENRRERERQQNFRGKGPRNYNRSDDRIKEDINDKLSDDPWIDASEIDITVSNGEVTITGTVHERTAKRRAEDIAEQVSGVKHVENRVRVGTQSSGSTNSGTGGSGSLYGNEASPTQSGVTGTSATSTEKSKSK